MKPLIVLITVLPSLVVLIPSNEIAYVPEPVAQYEVIEAQVTAYTASAEETDDTPDIVASGKKAQVGMAACPGRYAFGTVVEIAGRVLVCEDRMHKRFRDSNHFDILLASKEEAFEFGRQNIPVKILKNG